MSTTYKIFEHFHTDLRLSSRVSKMDSNQNKVNKRNLLIDKVMIALVLLQDFGEEIPSKSDIKFRLYHYFSNITYLEGFTLPDMMKDNDSNASVEFVPQSPLAVPDTFIASKKGETKECTREIYNECREGKDSQKYKAGNNCYVDGAVFTKLGKDMKVLKAGTRYDLIFDTLGLEGSYTIVKVRTATSRQKQNLGNLIDGMREVLVGLKPNARTTKKYSNMRHKMLVFGSNISKTKKVAVPFKPNRQIKFKTSQHYNRYRPKNILNFTKTIKATMTNFFPLRFNQILESETNELGGNFLGEEFPQTLDLSVNIGNEPHYDMRDHGPGIGIWLKAGNRMNKNPNWYFILPNASIENSKGVAIELAHGTLIEWDGTKIKHCTMFPDVSDDSELKNSPLIGILVGPKTKFTDSSGSFSVNVGCKHSISKKIGEINL